MSNHASIFTVALLLGCGGGVSSQSKGVVHDRDGDGFDELEDCDDDDAAIHPDAVETCDGIDNDCDGFTDASDVDATGIGLWYADSDGDGYGDPGGPLKACEQPSGSVTDNTDCNDGDEAVHPGAAEVCGTAWDDDCDTDTDDADDCVDWLLDADGDGYGGEESRCLCAPADGYTSLLGGDCDDEEPGTHPAAEELCNDGVDQDCDGDALECRFHLGESLGSYTTRMIGNATGGGAGEQVATAGDVNGDGMNDSLVGAPGQGGGVVYLVHSPLFGEMQLEDADLVLFDTSGSQQVGPGVGAGDTNGDGYDDVLVGDRFYSGGMGRVALVLGPTSGSMALGAADLILTGSFNSEAGVPAPAGDTNADGTPDFLVGAPGAAVAYLVTGSVSSSGSLQKLAHEIRGAVDLGSAVQGVGDTDGDGLDDLLLSAPNEGTGGMVYLVLGPGTGVGIVDDAACRFEGSSSGDGAGSVLTMAGDLDEDGYADLVIGAPLADANGSDAGAIYLARGPFSGTVALGDLTDVFVGANAKDEAGSAIGVGDLDADGWADLALGAVGVDEEASGAGAVFLAYGPLSGSWELGDVDGRIDGERAEDAAGASLTVIGDVDGNALEDLLIGVPGDDREGIDAGMAVLVHGRGL